MILYVEFLGEEISDSETPESSEYQIIYSNYGIGEEKFSMNFFNKLTGKYQDIKKNSRIWSKGLSHARYSWKRDLELRNKLNSSLRQMR